MVTKTAIYEAIYALLEKLDDGGVWDFVEYLGKDAPSELSGVMESVGQTWKGYEDWIYGEAEGFDMFAQAEPEPPDDSWRD